MKETLRELQGYYEQISQNQIGRFEPGLTKDAVVSACKKIVENINRLRISTDDLLKSSLYPQLENIAAISDEDEEDIYDTVQKLSSYTISVDPGLAFSIYKMLLSLARRKGDVPKTIRYLYWCGITLHYVDRLRQEQKLAYFEEGASYADEYFSFENPETRQYIHRCLGNKHMVYCSIKNWEAADLQEQYNFGFWNNILFAGADAGFPWLSYFITCLNHKHSYITGEAHADLNNITKKTQNRMLDTAITINKLYNKNRELFAAFGGTRYEFIVWEAQFLSGLISFDQLKENVYNKNAEIVPDDYSVNAMFTKVQMKAYLMFYAANINKLKDLKNEVLKITLTEIFEYFSNIPMTVNPKDVGSQLLLFSRNLGDILEPSEHYDFVLKMTTYRHIPTYAHSVMVGKIASYLTKEIINRYPENFVGCLDIESADEITERSAELCDFAEKSGLYHDVGKITYINNPFIHSRVLTEEEIAIVKRHTDDGKALMGRKDGVALYGGFIDVIWGHHKYFDNSGGYPDDFNITDSKHKMIINIITTADSIDAATDEIGRMYETAKPLEKILEEIKAGSGKRYSPLIAEVLSERGVVETIGRILETERPEAYYAAYLHAWK